jgi:hypothetical protein
MQQQRGCVWEEDKPRGISRLRRTKRRRLMIGEQPWHKRASLSLENVPQKLQSGQGCAEGCGPPHRAGRDGLQMRSDLLEPAETGHGHREGSPVALFGGVLTSVACEGGSLSQTGGACQGLPRKLESLGRRAESWKPPTLLPRNSRSSDSRAARTSPKSLHLR